MNEQIRLFEEVTLPNLENSSRESLSKYLFVIGSGGNDYTLNYILNISRSNVSVEAFTDILIATLSSQIKVIFSWNLFFFSRVDKGRCKSKFGTRQELGAPLHGSGTP